MAEVAERALLWPLATVGGEWGLEEEEALLFDGDEEDDDDGVGGQAGEPELLGLEVSALLLLLPPKPAHSSVRHSVSAPPARMLRTRRPRGSWC